MSNKTLLLFFAISVFSFTACKKEEGPAGPAGKDGNANVKSMMITVNQLEWNGDGYGYSAEKPCSIITPAIAESGAVMCYYKEDDTYVPLPASINYLAQYTTHMLFAYTPGNIEFFTQDDDGLTPSPDQAIFKVVAISSAGMQLNPDLDINNYYEVKQAFDLED
jgi:hypothetical protein